MSRGTHERDYYLSTSVENGYTVRELKGSEAGETRTFFFFSTGGSRKEGRAGGRLKIMRLLPLGLNKNTA